MKLILGTAEFDPSGYSGAQAPTSKEIRKILACAKEAGINIIDTAESYNCNDVLSKEAKGFCIYTKTRTWNVNLSWGDNELRGILYHYNETEGRVEMPFIHRWVNLGSSVYQDYQLPKDTSRILQIPLNIINSSFAFCFESYRTIFVRSVFSRGELLKMYSIKECLDFVKIFRPDGIIVGVKTAKELEVIVKAYGRD